LLEQGLVSSHTDDEPAPSEPADADAADIEARDDAHDDVLDDEYLDEVSDDDLDYADEDAPLTPLADQRRELEYRDVLLDDPEHDAPGHDGAEPGAPEDEPDAAADASSDTTDAANDWPADAVDMDELEEQGEVIVLSSEEEHTHLPPLTAAAERASQVDDRHDRDDLMNYLNPGLTPLQKVMGTLAALLLVALLGAQVAHHFRTELAQHPEYGQTVRDTYERAGYPIRIQARHRDYDVVRHTVVPRTDDANVLQVRATVANQSGGLRPPPHVRVTFYDRFGEERFVRTFAPAQYSDELTGESLLGASDRIEVALDVVDVDPAATTNYLVEACAEMPSDQVSCSDPATRTAPR
ncbi:MAG: DUF3426 domain-containing protein, partial [Pseudomonadota bacterium]